MANVSNKAKKIRNDPLKFNITVDLNYSGVELDRSTYHPCQNGNSCCDDDYCRCGEITIDGIAKVNPLGIIHSCFPSEKCILNIEDNQSFLYAMERLFILSDLDSKDSAWDISIEDGYYGQELGDCKLQSKLAEKLQAQGLALIGMKREERINSVLLEEYGWLLPHVEDVTYSVESISMDLVRPSDTWKRRFSNVDHDKWELQDDIPQGIVRVVPNGRYKIVDGHHRILSAREAGKKEIRVYVVQQKKTKKKKS